MKRNNASMYAIRNMVKEVHNLSKLDQCTTTFLETQAIIDGVFPSTKVEFQEFETILNLKRGWKELINSYHEFELSIEDVSKYHKIIAEGLVIDAGYIRTGDVGVNNVTWQPPIPNKREVEQNIIAISKIVDPIDRALEYLCYGIRNQLFYDGNKRVSFIISNIILIQNDIGLISVPEEHYTEFNELLKELFNQNKVEKMKCFLLEKCVDYQPKHEIKK